MTNEVKISAIGIKQQEIQAVQFDVSTGLASVVVFEHPDTNHELYVGLATIPNGKYHCYYHESTNGKSTFDIILNLAKVQMVPNGVTVRDLPTLNNALGQLVSICAEQAEFSLSEAAAEKNSVLIDRIAGNTDLAKLYLISRQKDVEDLAKQIAESVEFEQDGTAKHTIFQASKDNRALAVAGTLIFPVNGRPLIKDQLGRSIPFKNLDCALAFILTNYW